MRYIVFFALCVFAAGSPCASAPIPKGTENTSPMFPTKVGQKWVYTVSDVAKQEKDVEIVESVTRAEVKDGITTVMISRLHTDGEMYPNRIREVSDKGVIQPKGESGDLLDEPWVHLKLPHKAGQSWKSLDKRTYTAFGPEKITVPAGEYETIRVEMRDTVKPDSPLVQTNWYAPHVGIVKIVTKRFVYVLKSFKQPE